MVFGAHRLPGEVGGDGLTIKFNVEAVGVNNPKLKARIKCEYVKYCKEDMNNVKFMRKAFQEIGEQGNSSK